jgi:PAS domain S-box-containing protein
MFRAITGFLEVAPDAIIVIDNDGVIIIVNGEAEKMFGCSREELLGQKLEILIPERFRVRHVFDRSNFMDSGAQLRPMKGINIYGLRKNGDEFPAEIGLATMICQNGSAVVSAIIRDVTAQREELRIAEEGSKHKEEFLAMLAHELRNPLSVVSNGIQLLGFISQTQEASEHCQMIARHVRHLSRLVDDLMDTSRLTRGKINLNCTVFEIKDAIRQGIEAANMFAAEKGHVLTVDLAPEVMKVHADFTRISQIVINLVHNAAKYTPDGGKIKVILQRENADNLLIRVEDNGIGIPENMKHVIFDMFTQAEYSLDHAQGGLGIGLTLVRSIAMMHNGGVWADSEGQGKGSQFFVRLPVLKTEEEPSKKASECPKSRRILVVDDITDIANSMSMLLKLEGHEVYTANDGSATLQCILANNPEVVLLDIGMPGMNGYEIARRIRESNKDIRLIALTGFGSDEDRRKSKAAGFDHHLVKPIEPKDLWEYIK